MPDHVVAMRSDAERRAVHDLRERGYSDGEVAERGRVAEYAYARYFFSTLSGDIRGLFCAACEALDVRWTLSNPRNVSVAHRASVARLDAIGCAKA